MADFGSLDEVDAELGRLADGSEPLVAQVARRPGQKEVRWTQLLAGEPESDAVGEPVTETGKGAAVTDAAVAVRSVSLDDVVTSLRADVDALRDEVQRISAIVEELRSTFDL
jgi:uncharacterized protein YceH (UPF0502 family)